mgnify:CR=1 FL=1
MPSAPAPEAQRIESDLTTRAYALRAETFDVEKRSVEAVIATETPAQVVDWERWEVIDEVLRMDGAVLPKNRQIPFLDAHSRWSAADVLGSTRELRVEGETLVGRNFFSSAPSAQEAATKVREGHITDNSIGYRVLASVTLEPNTESNVNGKLYRAGARALRIATQWEVRENSLVPIGADSLAKMRAAHFKGVHMSKEQAAATDAGRSHTPAAAAPVAAEPQRAAEPVKTIAPAELEQARQEAVKVERQRVAEIRKEGESSGVRSEAIERVIQDGRSLEEARALFLADIRAQRSESVGAGPAIHVPQREVNVRALSNGMLLRMGVTPKDSKEAEAADELRDLSVIDVCREALRLDRITPPRGRLELLRAAVATLSLPKIFSNVANKMALMGFEEAPSTIRRWCRLKDVKDFKTNRRAGLGEFPDLPKVGNGGEVLSGTFDEDYEDYAIDQYANTFSYTEKDMVNDDLNVLETAPRKMGRAALRLEDNLGYTHLLANGTLSDSIALFHASHGNLISGASTAFSHTALGALKTKMRKQVGLDGRTVLNIEPRFLLTPPELEWLAKEVLKSSNIVISEAGSTTSATLRGSSNVHENSLELIVEPRLSNSNFTGYSTTAWFLAGDPNAMDTFELGFLEGTNRQPRIEQVQAPPNILAFMFRVVHAVGVKALDHRGLARSAGA